MPNSKQIVYLSQAQYQELITNGTITVDGVTVTYDENDIYVTPQAEPVTDVRIEGTSVSSNGVANIPVATNNSLGVVRAVGNGIQITANGYVQIAEAASSAIKLGTSRQGPITVLHQHESVFYGLSKIAGVDLASETVTVGTYPDASKGAIQTMLGVDALIAPTEPSTMAFQAYAINDLFLNDGKLYKATAAISEGAAFDSTSNCQVTSISEMFVKKTDYATDSRAGVGKVSTLYGVQIGGADHIIKIYKAESNVIKEGTNIYRPIVPSSIHEATFYGLAKAAGSDLASVENVTVGTYPDATKAAIRSMIGAENGDDLVKVQDTQPSTAATKLWFKETQDDGVSVPTVSEMETALAGKVGDVQVNGTSIVSSGTANIPLATASVFGAVKLGDSFSIDSSSKIILARASDAQVKAGTNNSNALVPLTQHHSVFYGLAKAAGDTTQSASSNTVGTYTDSAKNAIHTMLGTADLIEVGFVETVTGSTPSITGKANYRYNCGELTTLSITPPAAGSIDVYFTSGSTATVLTVPNTVKWPVWFDATVLDSNTIYELLITDATYGSVMTWAT